MIHPQTYGPDRIHAGQNLLLKIGVIFGKLGLSTGP